ncbi:DNA-directed DNA polymerase gamma mip1, partial [Dimargaris xerosporica]
MQNVSPNTIRTNPLGIQMLSPSLQRAVFPQQRDNPVHPEQIALSKEHLKRQGIWGKKTTQTQPLDLHPPPLRGATIQEHFWQLGTEMAEPYLPMAKKAVAMALPPLPRTWQEGQSGWTRYAYPTEASRGANTPVITTVPYPLEDILVFDVEVLFKQSQFPILACAASEHAWYLWVSPYLLNVSDQFDHLIPLSAQDRQPRVIIGHNVGFDRIRVADEYRLKPTGHCYLDTMSLHSAVSGLCNQQRVDWMYYQGVVQNAESSTPKPRAPSTKAAPYQLADLKLMASVGSTNSLKQVAKLHCGVDLDKEVREMFNTSDKQEIVDNFQLAVTYCAKDVLTTHQVYRAVFPKFLQKCPHPVSFAGMVDMASAILPVTDRWEQFIATCEAQFTTLSATIETKIQNLAEAALALPNTTEIANDPWLRHLDWTVAPIRMTKPKLLKDGRVAPGGEPRPMARQKLPGKPEWYKSLWDAKAQAIKVTTKTRITPYLLKLKWRGYPLYFSDAYGWTYRVPREQADAICETPLAFASNPADPAYEAYPAQDHDGCYFRIPHPDGDGLRCLHPLGKSYIAAFEDGVLTSEYEEAREALQLSALCSYWISCRERVKSQLVIWDMHRP